MQGEEEKMNRLNKLVTLVLAAFCMINFNISKAEVYRSALHEFEVKKVVDGLSHPWGLAFLPEGGFLVTERVGNLRIVSIEGTLSQPLEGLPKISAAGQGGLMDIVLHPRFSENSTLFMSFVAESNGLLGTEVVRGTLSDGRLINTKIIFRALPKARGGRHFGSRLFFLKDGSLLVSLGDRGDRPNGQNLATHPGSIVRIKETGGHPPNNPFVQNQSIQPEIYTFGNRNVQGLFWDEQTDNIWATEHGPQGGCELNLIQPGLNYGWAEITHGKNYIIGTGIGEGTSRIDVEPPVYYWSPSNAPSGLTLYRGSEFSGWNGNLFVGSLKFKGLSRLILQGRKVTSEERLLEGKIGRVRTVLTGPEGLIYILTDESNGRILRLQPTS